MADIGDILADIRNELVDIKRRVEVSHRDGKVVELDPEKGLIKVDLGTDKSPMVTEWIPWVERAGAQKTWNPPTVGEAISVVAPGGEMALARGVPGGFSAAFQQPSQEGGAYVSNVGSSTLTQRDGQTIVAAPKVDLGAAGGMAVARIGDHVLVGAGSSAGLWPIVEGSGSVFAAD